MKFVRQENLLCIFVEKIFKNAYHIPYFKSTHVNEIKRKVVIRRISAYTLQYTTPLHAIIRYSVNQSREFGRDFASQTYHKLDCYFFAKHFRCYMCTLFAQQFILLKFWVDLHAQVSTHFPGIKEDNVITIFAQNRNALKTNVTSCSTSRKCRRQRLRPQFRTQHARTFETLKSYIQLTGGVLNMYQKTYTKYIMQR